MQYYYIVVDSLPVKKSKEEREETIFMRIAFSFQQFCVTFQA